MFKIGDILEDMKECGVIEIVGIDEFGYDVKIDDQHYEYGINEYYMIKNCRLLNRNETSNGCIKCSGYDEKYGRCFRVGVGGENKGIMGVCWMNQSEGEY